MSRLEKAKLQEIDSRDNPVGQPVDVQFNPATLRLQMTNSVEGGATRARQARQYAGTGSTVLSLELNFDTADEGTTRGPVSVRDKTALVERFVLPSGQGREKQAPPRVRFSWGRLILNGVIDNISIDLDHFASDGTPLRAKVTLSIKEQDSRYQGGQIGPGANQPPAAPATGRPGTPITAPDAGGAAGGGLSAALSANLSAGLDIGLSANLSAGLSLSAGVSLGVSAGASLGVSAGVSLGVSAGLSVDGGFAVQAMGGESLPELAARAGIEPAAWRALAPPGGDPLRLEAGKEVEIPGAVSAGPGLGSATAVQEGAAATPERAVGLAAPAGADESRQLASGYALSAAGGVSAAVEQVRAARVESAAESTRAAFGAPAPPTPAATDARAASFGLGVPLRQTVGGEAGRRGTTLPPQTDDPNVPRWAALPADASRAAGRVESGGAVKRPCGCGGKPA